MNSHEHFQRQALHALAEMKKGGQGFELGTVRDYFARLAALGQGRGRKPRKPRLTRVV